MNHAYQNFYVYVPEHVNNEKDFTFEFRFTNMADALKGNYCGGEVCIGSVRKVNSNDATVMFV